MMERAPLILVLAAAAWGQTAAEPMAILERARTRLAAAMRRLPRYTCVETLEREFFVLPEGAAPDSCNAMIDGSENRRQLRREMTDRLRLDVAVSSEGEEIYSWAGATRFESRPLNEIVAEGTTSTGSFGSYLNDIFENRGTTFQYAGERTDGAGKRLAFVYRVPAQASHYAVRAHFGVGGAAGSWYTSAYEGVAEIDPDSLALVKLTIRTDALPPATNMCRASTTLDYQMLHIGGEEFPLPRASELRTIAVDGSESRSVTRFANCREYGAESTVNFGDEAAAGAKATAANPISVPAWVPVELVLERPIDTDTAATGDAITAKLGGPMHKPRSKETVAPAGARVHGRITRMEHHFGREPYFLIGMAFDSIEVGGVAAPFSAMLDMPRQPASRIQFAARLDLVPSEGALIPFPTRALRLVIPAGEKMFWITQKPAAVTH